MCNKCNNLWLINLIIAIVSGTSSGARDYFIISMTADSVPNKN